MSAFTNSGHSSVRAACQLWANSGLMHRSREALFDNLIGELLQLWGYIDSERPSGLEVNHQLEFGRLLHRQIGGLGPFQYFVHKHCGSPKQVRDVRPVGQE